MKFKINFILYQIKFFLFFETSIFIQTSLAATLNIYLLTMKTKVTVGVFNNRFRLVKKNL